MNKYQKALDYLAENSMYETVERSDLPDGVIWKEVTQEGIEAQELLQELVDRATPKKVFDKHPFKSFGWCPNCNCSINRRYYPKFCGCGQALDWSE